MALITKQCAFCGKVGPHPKAHIFPRALHRGDPGVAFMVINFGSVAPAKRSPTGFYDNELWCNECESRSAEIDKYAFETLLDESIRKPLPDFIDPQGKQLLFEIVGADPVRIAVFVLSVLWRASASKRPEVRGFTLGPYEERVREAISTADPQKVAEFPALIRFETMPIGQSSFITPARVRSGDFVVFHGGGFEFHVKVNNRPLAIPFQSWAILPGRPVLIGPYSLLETKTGKKLHRQVIAAEQKFGPQNRYIR